jgi:cytochrome c553
MKIFNLRLALQTAVLAIATAFPAAGRAADKSIDSVPRQSFEAKLEYCKTCHGLSGQGYRGYFPMPRLAGQQPKYIENQLRAFVERTRTNPVMSNVAHALSPGMIAALAEHFKALNPPPIGGAPRDSLALGKTIYELGLPEANVPACSACHGPDAKGAGEIPRLAGQLFPYTVKELTSWSKERGENLSALMMPTSHNLTQSQIAAVAAYVSTLK